MFRLILLAVISVVVFADVQFGLCRDKSGKLHRPGDTWYEAGCKIAICGLSPMGEMYIERTGCPTPKVTEPCEVAYKPYGDYPDCCPFEKCTYTESDPNAYVWNAHGHGRK